jgi:PBP1b-binding outer membrane lipoprotein LpoB
MPIVYVGAVKNDTQDYTVNSKLITEVMETQMINSGRARIKAPRDLRSEGRDERLDTKYNDPATIKAVAKELNADFALVGDVQQSFQKNNAGDRIANYYMVNMELINVETQEVVWKKNAELKKTAYR